MSKTGQVVKERSADRFLLMVGYSPNKMPYRGADGFIDLCQPEVVEKACWRFMSNGAGAGLMHKARPDEEEPPFRVTENSIYRNPVPWVFKAADGSEVTITEGDWLIGVICSPQVWDDYRKGRYRGGSLQGKALRMAVTPETLARVRS